MNAPTLAARRSVGPPSGQTLLIAAWAVGAAIWVASAGLQSAHAFAYEAVPVLLAPVAVWMFFSERYEITLAVLLLYLGLLDGVVKLASGSSVATLGRDILLVAITSGAVVRLVLRKTPLEVPPYAGFVIAWVVLCVMQLANPLDVSLVHAAVALRQHLEFVPLFFFGYFVIRSQRRLTGLLVLLLIIGAANGIVDVIQAGLSTTQLASWGPGYAGLEHGTATEVARVFVNAAGQAQVRPPGLGGEDGFGGMVGVMALPGAIALLSTGRRTAKLGWFLVPATVLAIAGIVTSQTRLDLVAAAIALLAFLALTVTSRRGLTALLVTAIVGVAGYAIVSVFVSTSANRYATISPTKVVGTVGHARTSTIALIPHYLEHYPLGAGLGSVGPAAGSLIGGSTLGSQLDGESEVTFLLIETGIPGLLIMLTFTLAMIRAGIALHRVADPELQRCLMALAAVLISLLAAWFIGAVTADSPTSPFIWFSSGCLAYWYGEQRAGRLGIRPRRVSEELATR